MPPGNDGLQADRQNSTISNLTLKPLMIKQDKGHNAARYCRISQVENRRKEHETVSAYKRHPRGPVPRHQREIKHVHDAPPKKHIVAETPRCKVGHSGRGGRIEYDTVKDAIDDVPQRTCRDQSNAHEIPDTLIALEKFPQIPRQATGGDNTKTREHVLVYKLHTESHAPVLRKENIKPVRHTDAFVQSHMGLHPKLRALVNEQDTQYGAQDNCKALSAHFFFKQSSLPETLISVASVAEAIMSLN